jgi:hypothetical protein
MLSEKINEMDEIDEVEVKKNPVKKEQMLISTSMKKVN